MIKYLSLIFSLLLFPLDASARTLPKHKAALQVSYQVEVPTMAFGSAFAFSTRDDGTLFATNDHVCQATRGKGIFKKSSSRRPLNTIKPVVIDSEGNKFAATVVKTSNLHSRTKDNPGPDLCLLWVAKTDLPVGVLSKGDPEVGEEIFSVSGPLGIFPVIHQGFVGPTLSFPQEEEHLPARVASLTVTHGSSGGAVFNSEGQIVGVVFAFIPGEDSVGVALFVPVSQLHSFVGEYLKEKK